MVTYIMSPHKQNLLVMKGKISSLLLCRIGKWEKFVLVIGRHE